jgi:hypothetical protein
MIMVILAIVCVVTVPLTGGRLSRLADLPVRALWTAPLALVAQVVILSILPNGSRSVHIAINYGTYALVAVFLLANLRIPGVAMIALGAVSNTVVIIANGGVMPEWETARRIAGMVTEGGFRNAALVAHSHLQWFGDVIPIPGPWPLRNVLSIGDVLIFAGMLVLLHRTCRTSLVRRDRRPVTA